MLFANITMCRKKYNSFPMKLTELSTKSEQRWMPRIHLAFKLTHILVICLKELFLSKIAYNECVVGEGLRQIRQPILISLLDYLV